MGEPSQLEIIVILVSADPEPIVTASPLAGERAIAATDLGGINAAFLAEAWETFEILEWFAREASWGGWQGASETHVRSDL